LLCFKHSRILDESGCSRMKLYHTVISDWQSLKTKAGVASRSLFAATQ